MIWKKIVFGIFLLLLKEDGVRSLRITPPKKLGPGETRVQPPGWQHCINTVKAKWKWQRIMNDGYPKFAGTQLQCSWIVEAPIGWKVKFAFQDLHMTGPAGKSCRSQYVAIIDMGTGTSQGRFCGKKPPGDYVSSGTLLRLDLHGDKTKTTNRGFMLKYKFVKEKPGFRDQRILYTAISSSPGKADFSNFLSMQQKRITSQARVGARPAGPFVYASNRRDGAGATAPPRPDSGWQGDDGLPLATQASPQRRVPGGARITAKPKITPKKSSGNRITAANQRRDPNNAPSDNDDPDSDSDDGWVNPPSNNNPGFRQRPGYYGSNIQPDYAPGGDSSQNNRLRPNLLVVHKESGLSTTNLIIIVAAIVICFLIVVAIFVIKRFYFDKTPSGTVNDNTGKEKSDSKDAVEAESSNRHRSLPGMARTISAHSMHSMHSTHASNEGVGARKMSRLATPLPPTPHEQARATRSMILRDSTMRPTAPPMLHHHEPIYCNERPSNHQSRHMQHHRDVRFERPPPSAPPYEPKAVKEVDIDEDYCSGSDANAEVTTLRRVYSQWEMDQKKRKRK